MRVSIVTISFNQANFLEQAIRSVINQDYPDIEYIVVDPGSTDGSREIIKKYQDRIDKIIFEADEGPADGLNKGFAHATGDIFGFINADDYLLPRALYAIATAFKSKPQKDVLSGNVFIVDRDGRVIRRFYSRKYTPLRAVYGAATLAQQGTFFRSDYFRKAGGFNESNRVAWDGEFWFDMALNGARFGRLNRFLAVFRIHVKSITLASHSSKEYEDYKNELFKRILQRKYTKRDNILRLAFKTLEYLENPKMVLERLLPGNSWGITKW